MSYRLHQSETQTQFSQNYTKNILLSRKISKGNVTKSNDDRTAKQCTKSSKWIMLKKGFKYVTCLPPSGQIKYCSNSIRIKLGHTMP